MLPEIHVGQASELAVRLVSLLESRAEQAQARRRPCGIALPGGSVAAILFPYLARAQCDWSRVAFFWGDERAVPPEHAESNYGLARRLWLEPAGVPRPNIHRMPADEPDAERAARSYQDTLTRTLGTSTQLDLVLLGVGADGHVCSLFPGHRLLGERHRLVAAIDDAPKPPPRRLTLTLPVLWAAEVVAVAALGEAKAPVLREALEDPASELPVARAVRGARRAIALLDPPAASLLQDR